MRKQGIKHHMDGLAALLLFVVFAACILVVLLTGADAYRRLTQRDQAAYDRRTAVQYVATRVRQADQLGSIRVEPFGDTDALVLVEDDEYVTRVYCYDGYMMELYASELEPLTPDAGEPIMEVGGLSFSLEDGLLTVTAADPQGKERTLLLSLRSGEGVRP